MIITIVALVIWLIVSLPSAIAYLVVVVAATFIMSWFAAFSSTGVAASRSKNEQGEMFKRLMFGAVFGSPWWPLHLIGIVAAAIVFFL